MIATRHNLICTEKVAQCARRFKFPFETRNWLRNKMSLGSLFPLTQQPLESNMELPKVITALTTNSKQQQQVAANKLPVTQRKLRAIRYAN